MGRGRRAQGRGRRLPHRPGEIALSLASPFGVGDSVYHHGTKPQVVDHIPFGAYLVSALRAVGGWDERLTVNEDFELDLRLRRAGYELLFDPDGIVHGAPARRFGRSSHSTVDTGGAKPTSRGSIPIP